MKNYGNKNILGYVYYEGDCFMSLRNPYIVVDVDQPSLAQKAQKLLKGEGLEVSFNKRTRFCGNDVNSKEKMYF